MAAERLNIWEGTLLQIVSTKLPGEDCARFAQQVAAAEVVRRPSPGNVLIDVPGGANRLSSVESFPVHGWYFDGDGGLVSILVHVDAERAALSFLERYRVDGAPIQLLWPRLDQVRLQTSPGPQSLKFDPVHGWSCE